MKQATVFENLLLINGEINQNYVYPNLERNCIIRFLYRRVAKWYRKQLVKRINRYNHNSFPEVVSFLEACQRMYPPDGKFKNIHSVIIMDDKCISSVVESSINEVVGNKHIVQIIYTITCYDNNPEDCDMVATTVHDDGTDRYMINTKGFDVSQIQSIRKANISQKRILEFLLIRLHDILVSNAQEFLKEEIERSERIEL